MGRARGHRAPEFAAPIPQALAEECRCKRPPLYASMPLQQAPSSSTGADPDELECATTGSPLPNPGERHGGPSIPALTLGGHAPVCTVLIRAILRKRMHPPSPTCLLATRASCASAFAPHVVLASEDEGKEEGMEKKPRNDTKGTRRAKTRRGRTRGSRTTHSSSLRWMSNFLPR